MGLKLLGLLVLSGLFGVYFFVAYNDKVGVKSLSQSKSASLLRGQQASFPTPTQFLILKV